MISPNGSNDMQKRLRASVEPGVTKLFTFPQRAFYNLKAAGIRQEVRRGHLVGQSGCSRGRGVDSVAVDGAVGKAICRAIRVAVHDAIRNRFWTHLSRINTRRLLLRVVFAKNSVGRDSKI